MSSFRFQNTQFVKSAAKPNQYPLLRGSGGAPLPEVAVIGRSNVGKSSLLNHLFKRKNLVKTSSTPGKTDLINFFVADEEVVFTDLPGFGFAKVPLEKKASWGPMVESYFLRRLQVRALLFLFDIRRLPKEEDKRLLHWFLSRGIRVILVLTKVDKVKPRELGSQTRAIVEGLSAEGLDCLHYSTLKNIGRLQLVKALKELLCPKSD